MELSFVLKRLKLALHFFLPSALETKDFLELASFEINLNVAFFFFFFFKFYGWEVNLQSVLPIQYLRNPTMQYYLGGYLRLIGPIMESNQ